MVVSKGGRVPWQAVDCYHYKCILVGYLLMCTWCLAWTWLHDSRHAWLPLAITGDRTQPQHSSRPNHYTDTLQGSKETTILLHNLHVPMTDRQVVRFLVSREVRHTARRRSSAGERQVSSHQTSGFAGSPKTDVVTPENNGYALLCTEKTRKQLATAYHYICAQLA